MPTSNTNCLLVNIFAPDWTLNYTKGLEHLFQLWPNPAFLVPKRHIWSPNRNEHFLGNLPEKSPVAPTVKIAAEFPFPYYGPEAYGSRRFARDDGRSARKYDERIASLDKSGEAILHTNQTIDSKRHRDPERRGKRSDCVSSPHLLILNIPDHNRDGQRRQTQHPFQP